MKRDPTPEELREISELIHEKYDIDFSQYALSSFTRRVRRILDIFHMEDSHDLKKQILSNPAFVRNFVKEITVNTTEKFRDPQMWRELREWVLPTLSKKDRIMVWHAACSTGEEVFSLSILMREEGLLPRTKAFASDINEDVIQTAKKGHYPLAKLELHHENYVKSQGKGHLSDYYTVPPGDRVYAMDPDLIKNVSFMAHDLVKGKMHLKFDLILLRNVLIYFDLDLQNRVVTRLLDSLNIGGYLVLGSKESLTWTDVGKKLEIISREEKIYQKTQD